MSNNIFSKGLLLGENTTKFTYFIINENDALILENKEYFNKHTENIKIYKCKIGNELVQIIDSSKEVLYIQVLYTINYFGTDRRYRVKDYIYMDNKLYMHNKNIKREPKEIKSALKEYYSI